jgi:succinate dehydrogenase/fumarate reductase flavoprotein subunit
MADFLFFLLAAIVGGWIAGRYAVHAQKHAAKEQRQSDLEAEGRAVNGTLQAIKPSWKFSTPSWLES